MLDKTCKVCYNVLRKRGKQAMMKEYQVTLMCATGKYKPVSCIIKREEIDLANTASKKELINQGIQKICNNRYWTKLDLLKYDYTKVKVREYNKEELAAVAKERYEAIKEAKYASGEWKRPKNK